MVAACVTNVATDVLFVAVLKGRPGAAVSTVLAQLLSLALAFGFLIRRGYVRRYRAAQPAFCRKHARALLGMGLPIAAQEGLVNISFLIITAIVNGMGLVASAAVGGGGKADRVQHAAHHGLCGGRFGHGGPEFWRAAAGRARACMNTGIGLSLLFGLACFASAQVNAAGLVSLFARTRQ